MEAYARVVRESFVPKVSEQLKEERERRERSEKRKQAELRFIREQKYRDYLLESRMSGRQYKTHDEQPYANMDIPSES